MPRSALVEVTPEDVLLLAASHRVARAVVAAAEIDLAAALASGPRDVAALADVLQCDVRGLRLLMRALASEGVFEQVDGSDTFALNEAARALLPAEHGGMRELILGWAGHPAVYRGMERLADGVRRGRPAFELAHGTGFFDWLGGHDDEMRSYQTAVGGEDPEEFVPMLDVVDLSAASVVADIGGGSGGLLRAAVDRWPHLRGMLIELPPVAAATERRMKEAGYDDRIDCVAASCLEQVPAGADVYVMTTVLRYFNDADAAVVLDNVGTALASASGQRRIIVSEMPIDEGAAQSPGAMKSLVEYALSGGQDRTRAELQRLLTGAGFVHVRFRPWWGPHVAVEAELP